MKQFAAPFRAIPFLLIPLCLVFVMPVRTGAQVSTASINGIVLDSTGAVITGAGIMLHNVNTGVNANTSTNNSGEYVIANIVPGFYTLRASKPGFKTAQQNTFDLVVNQTLTANFTLSPGATEQTVTVEAPPPTIETSTAELGTVVETAAVNDLPLNGRNFTQLLTLTPGASPIDTAQTFGFRGVGSFAFPAFHGARNRGSLFLVDGVNDQGSINSTYAVPPIVDDIQEFKVDSHNDQVQFGGVSGGVVNVVTKSGANQYHGAAWEYLRNSDFDARNPFFSSVTALRQNQFGANGGGPVILPRYNGRNRTFFFVSYEGFRNRTPSQVLDTIPTSSQLSGNLSSLGVPIYNPFSTVPDPAKPGQFLRTPFSGGIIPASMIDPAMLAVAKAIYPTVNTTGSGGTNFSETAPIATNQNLYNIRLDQQLSTKDSFWFRFSHVDLPKNSQNPIGNAISTDDWQAHTIGANWTHTFGPTMVMQTSFGRTWAIDYSTSNVPNVSSSLISGFSSAFACNFPGANPCLLPSISLTGFTGTPGDTVQNQGASDIWSGQINVSKLWGKHFLTFGFDVNTNNLAELIVNDSVSFSPFQTTNLETPGNSGSALAAFLLGVPTGGSRRLQAGGETGGWVDGFYFGDQWKATSRLTVNWGVRYDLTLLSTWGSKSSGTAYVGSLNLNNGTYILQWPTPFCSATGAAPCIPGSSLPANVTIANNGHIFRTDSGDIAPRLGLAYRLNSKTVIRTGAGIFYDNWATWSQLGQSYGGAWPTNNQLTTANLNPDVVTVRAENPLSALGTGALPAATPFTQNITFKDPFMKVPYTEEWNFGIQRQLGSSTGLSVDYVGSHGSRLDLNTFANTAVTPAPGPQPPRRPYSYITPTNYERTVGRSSYEALEVSLNRRLSSGLSYLVSYTWSKSIDTSCSGWAGVEGCANQNPYNVNADKSVSAFDIPQVFTASIVYELPFGTGKAFRTGRHALDYVMGNWELNTITSLHSGTPFTIGVSGDIANTGNSNNAGFYERLNLVGNPSLSNPSPALWFNTSAFAVPAAFTFGNLGRNTLRSDWSKDLDLSLFRTFPIREKMRLEFRAEAFNLTNTPIWGTPGVNYSASTFGRVTSTANTPRQIQLALKLYF
jgi:Carboxypeptidase regulatory-like domain